MSKYFRLFFVFFMFVFLFGCVSEEEEYVFVFNEDFQTSYNVGDEEPDWRDAYKAQYKGEEVDIDINIDTSNVNMNEEGSFNVIYTGIINEDNTITETLKITIIKSDTNDQDEKEDITVSQVTANKKTYAYSETVLIIIYLDNPQDYEIQSVTIDSVEYDEFKEGSNNDLVMIEIELDWELKEGQIRYDLEKIKYFKEDELTTINVQNAGVTIELSSKGRIYITSINAPESVTAGSEFDLEVSILNIPADEIISITINSVVYEDFNITNNAIIIELLAEEEDQMIIGIEEITARKDDSVKKFKFRDKFVTVNVT